MGSFDITCCLTGRGIGCGDRVVAIAVAVSGSETAKGFQHFTPTPFNVTEYVAPVSLAVRGSYEDYGRIEVDEDQPGSVKHVFGAMFRPGDTMVSIGDILEQVAHDGLVPHNPRRYIAGPIPHSCGVWVCLEAAYDWILERYQKERLRVEEHLTRANRLFGEKYRESTRSRTLTQNADLVRLLERDQYSLFMGSGARNALFGAKLDAAAHLLTGDHVLHEEFADSLLFLMYHALGRDGDTFLEGLTKPLAELYTLSHGLFMLRTPFFLRNNIGVQFASESFGDIHDFSSWLLHYECEARRLRRSA